MDRDFFLRLATATYRVVHVLPEEEGMRYHIKDSANKIVADLFLFSEEEVVPSEHKEIIGARLQKEIVILQDYFKQVKSKQWINPQNFFVLEREYDKIKGFVEEFTIVINSVPRTQHVVKETEEATPSLSERQKKILDILRNKQRAQVWEFQKLLPEVTKRTLRRDLDDLLQLDLIERQGEWNEVFYQLKG